MINAQVHLIALKRINVGSFPFSNYSKSQKFYELLLREYDNEDRNYDRKRRSAPNILRRDKGDTRVGLLTESVYKRKSEENMHNGRTSCLINVPPDPTVPQLVF